MYINTLVSVNVDAGAYFAVAAWSAVRRTLSRQRSTDVLPSRDAEPSPAADDRGHRELVEESQRQVGHSTTRDVSGRGQ